MFGGDAVDASALVGQQDDHRLLCRQNECESGKSENEQSEDDRPNGEGDTALFFGEIDEGASIRPDEQSDEKES